MTTELTALGSRNARWLIPLGLLSPDSHCFTFGVGLDVTCEAAAHERTGAKWHFFDPVEAAGQIVQEQTTPAWATFEPIGVAALEGDYAFHGGPRSFGGSILSAAGPVRFTGHCERLAGILARYPAPSVLLKLDIEGSETEVVPDLIESGIRPPVFCIEFHDGPMDGDLLRLLYSAGYDEIGQVKGHRTMLLREVAADAP